MNAAPTRRAMLTGIASIPALAVAGCPAPAAAASYDAFETAVSRFLTARAADEADAKHGALRAAYDLHERRTASWSEKYDSPGDAPADIRVQWRSFCDEQSLAEDMHFDTFSRVRFEAAADLGKTPAPTLAALVRKFDLIKDEGDADDMLDDVMADVRRLASAA